MRVSLGDMDWGWRTRLGVGMFSLKHSLTRATMAALLRTFFDGIVLAEVAPRSFLDLVGD